MFLVSARAIASCLANPMLEPAALPALEFVLLFFALWLLAGYVLRRRK